LAGGCGGRENLDWLTRATNWAKFSATAGLGVIHRGHLSQVRFRRHTAMKKSRIVRLGFGTARQKMVLE
jgi:hypothetical protein